MFFLAEKESIAVYIILRMYVAVSIWEQLESIWILTMTAIFPRAFPAAALVDVRPEVAPEGAKLSVVCFALAGGLLAARAPFPSLLPDRFVRVRKRREIWNTNLGAAPRLDRVVDFGTSSISASSSSLSASTR